MRLHFLKPLVISQVVLPLLRNQMHTDCWQTHRHALCCLYPIPQLCIIHKWSMNVLFIHMGWLVWRWPSFELQCLPGRCPVGLKREVGVGPSVTRDGHTPPGAVNADMSLSHPRQSCSHSSPPLLPHIPSTPSWTAAARSCTCHFANEVYYVCAWMFACVCVSHHPV